MFVSKKRTWFLFTGLQLIACSLYLSSCNTIDLYEKDIPIPKHEWASAFKPQFTFTVKDTNAPYQLYILLRHNDKYNYNNIWINLYAQAPGQPVKKFTLELPLATGDKGWLGTAMDDLYDHRIALTLDPEKFNFNRPGNYSFTIEQIMREDPLENVLDVGLRLERKPH